MPLFFFIKNKLIFICYINYIYYICDIKLMNMEETIGINLQLPKELSLKIDRMLIDLKEANIKTTKIELVIKLIYVGLKSESYERD